MANNEKQWRTLGASIGAGLPWARRKSKAPNRAWDAFRRGFIAKRGPIVSVDDLIECKVEFAVFWDRAQRDRR